MPVLMAQKALRTHHAIMLVTTDPASVIDIPVFCAEAGYVLVSQEVMADRHLFGISRVGRNQPHCRANSRSSASP
jgi:TusA-related sulfurtransferase